MKEQREKIFVIAKGIKGFDNIIKQLKEYGYVEGINYFIISKGNKWTDADEDVLNLLNSHKRKSKPLEDRIENYKKLGQNLEYDKAILPKYKACKLIQNALQSGAVNDMEDVFKVLEKEKIPEEEMTLITDAVENELEELKKDPSYEYDMNIMESFPAPDVISIGTEGDLSEVCSEVITYKTKTGFIYECGEMIPNDDCQKMIGRVTEILESEEESRLPNSIVRDEHLEQWYYGKPVTQTQLDPIIEDAFEFIYGIDCGALGMRREDEIEKHYGVDCGALGKVDEKEISL